MRYINRWTFLIHPFHFILPGGRETLLYGYLSSGDGDFFVQYRLEYLSCVDVPNPRDAGERIGIIADRRVKSIGII